MSQSRICMRPLPRCRWKSQIELRDVATLPLAGRHNVFWRIENRSSARSSAWQQSLCRLDGAPVRFLACRAPIGEFVQGNFNAADRAKHEATRTNDLEVGRPIAQNSKTRKIRRAHHAAQSPV